VGVRPAARVAAASAPARDRPLQARLSPGAVGLALVLLVSAAWGTGVWFLLARLGLGSPVRLASVDGIHVYVGLVGGVFVAAKVARVGFRYRVEGVPGVVPWQRWISWSLLGLYGAVFVTGGLVLLPIPGRLYRDLVELHLLTSAWALAPTTWHVWHYRARAVPYLVRFWTRAPGRRFWAGLLLVAAAGSGLLFSTPALSQLPAVMGGVRWSPAPLSDAYLDRIALAPDGGALVAAGDALYVSRDGEVWVRVDIPVSAQPALAASPAAPAAGADQHPGHQHGQPPPPGIITALAVTPAAVYAGSASGLYASPGLDGPLAPVAFPGGAVRAIAVDPRAPGAIWVASAAGPYRTADGGRTWTRAAAGLATPERSAAIAWLDGDVFASDGTGMFRWSPDAGRWVRSSGQRAVTDLAAGAGRLYASSSADDDVWVLADGRWTDVGAPAPVHQHHGHLHGGLGPVTSVAGRLYAAGTSDGVSASADGGRTWTQLGGGLQDVMPGQVAAFHGDLWAATSGGLYRFALAPARPATPAWWAALLAAALAAGVAAVATSALPGRRRRR
jgi:hypothetical protein